jgi:hypothetical protein
LKLYTSSPQAQPADQTFSSAGTLAIIHDGDFEFLLEKAPSWVTTKLI